ncbi:MAG: sodium:calcium symporter, partial [Verrucomicrobiae bacterium]|nr:sodium:calcium symporter [Verrucomicrobiae bacterium]
MAASSSDSRPREKWSSRLGVILAVSGSAVGLGNFLRFPGQAAQYGGGAFMIAYFISFLLIGLPICWAEWGMGRAAGQKGYNSCPGIFNYIGRHPAAKYAGVIGVIIPVIIYMYYVTIEAWCL